MYMSFVPWWAWCFVASISIMLVEYFNRVSPSFLEALKYSLVFIILGQFALYRCFNGAPTWYMGWMVFTLANHVARATAVSITAGNEVNSWAYVIIGLVTMIGASMVLKLGLNG